MSLVRTSLNNKYTEMKINRHPPFPPFFVHYSNITPSSHFLSSDQHATFHYPHDTFMGDVAKRKSSTRESSITLKAWLNDHRKNPYPTKSEKVMLSVITKMSLTQVSTWFANARRRLKKENKYKTKSFLEAEFHGWVEEKVRVHEQVKNHRVGDDLLMNDFNAVGLQDCKGETSEDDNIIDSHYSRLEIDDNVTSSCDLCCQDFHWNNIRNSSDDVFDKNETLSTEFESKNCVCLTSSSPLLTSLSSSLSSSLLSLTSTILFSSSSRTCQQKLITSSPHVSMITSNNIQKTSRNKIWSIEDLISSEI